MFKLIIKPFILLSIFYTFFFSLSYSIENEACFLCHSNTELKKTLPNGQVINLFVNKEIFNQSIHKNRLCTDCHRDITSIPHKKEIEPVNCSGCHFKGNKEGAPSTDKYIEYRESVHGQALLAGNHNAPTCKSCHGTHD